MKRTLLKSKIHRATVTGTDLHYSGSLALDPDLIERADLVEFERVEIYNIANGERFATYVLLGERGSGDVVFYGAAALKAGVGDLVIICSYAEYDEREVASHQPTIVFVDADNRALAEPETRVAAAG
jgi:aspartate 1-decarboxylase